MAIGYHSSDGEGTQSLSKKSLLKRIADMKAETNGRFDVGKLYGKDFILDTNKYELGYDFIHVPCQYGDICPECGNLPRHTNEIFIAIDGACRSNGSAGARSSYGIFFAATSDYNEMGTIRGAASSSQKAELYACHRALQIVESKLQIVTFMEKEEEEHRLGKVVIKTDSDYLVKGVTEHMEGWRQNGFKNANGQTLVNHDLFAAIDSQLAALKEKEVECLFWHVPRGQNWQADELANRALDQDCGKISGGMAVEVLDPDLLKQLDPVLLEQVNSD